MFAVKEYDDGRHRQSNYRIGAMGQLAIDGGNPVRTELLPYGKQWIDEADIQAVVDVLRSDWLTTGPQIGAFEEELTNATKARHAIAVNSGTAALHAAMYAIDLQPGDEVIVPPMTFAASANAAIYLGGVPVFCDVDPETLLIDPAKIPALITKRTKAIVAVDYAGQPCDYVALRDLCDRFGLKLIADACHSIGGTYQHHPVGTLADVTCFSFHPVKAVTSGEGGAIVTDSPEYASRMKRFRNHNIATDFRQRETAGNWFYEVVDLGFNYRMSDLQAALGVQQMRKLPMWIWRRRLMARKYNEVFGKSSFVKPLSTTSNGIHAYHLYVVKLALEQLSVDRGQIFRALRSEGIGVNVHYIPVHLHPYYRETYGTHPGLCPVAEAAYEQILTLPLFPKMTDADCEDVIAAIAKVCGAYAK